MLEYKDPKYDRDGMKNLAHSLEKIAHDLALDYKLRNIKDHTLPDLMNCSGTLNLVASMLRKISNCVM